MEKYVKTIDFIMHSYKVNIGKYDDRGGVYAARALGALRAIFTMTEYDTDLAPADNITVQKAIQRALDEVKI